MTATEIAAAVYDVHTQAQGAVKALQRGFDEVRRSTLVYQFVEWP